jgi:hypothetical protein
MGVSMGAAVIHRYRVAYFPIPKNATSSVKRLIYELDAGVPFTATVQKSLGVSVHGLYPSRGGGGKWRPYFDNYTTIAVVRDPIKRLLSAYGNRVIERRVFEKTPEVRRQLQQRGLSLVPELDEFVEQLETYSSVSPHLRAHILPQSTYVGAIWDRLAIKLPIEQVGTLPDLIHQKTGQRVALPHVQAAGPKPSPKLLSDSHFNKVVSMFAADYEMLKDFYRPSDLLRA